MTLLVNGLFVCMHGYVCVCERFPMLSHSLHKKKIYNWQVYYNFPFTNTPLYLEHTVISNMIAGLIVKR